MKSELESELKKKKKTLSNKYMSDRWNKPKNKKNRIHDDLW